MAGETKAHRELKRGALFWAQTRGYRVAALEVKVPNSSYRADVAAYRPGDLNGRRGDDAGEGSTVIFECKQSRPDFLNDSRSAREALEKLEGLHVRREKLVRRLGAHYPNLRAGETLFPEYDGYDFDELGHEGYRKLVREIRLLENRVYGKTKFERLLRYGCAHLYYLVTAPGIVEAHEVPLNWGWLVMETPAAEEDGDPPRLAVMKKPVRQTIPEGRALALLQRLGIAGTAQFNRAEGICGEKLWNARRREV